MTTNTGTYREDPPESFTENDKSWDELGYSAQYYHYNKDNNKQVEYNKKIYQRNSEFVKGVKDRHSCTFCDEGYDACLVFHHIENKEYEISTMVKDKYSLQSIADEMNKCAILCANCHRKLHDGALDGGDIEHLSISP